MPAACTGSMPFMHAGMPLQVAGCSALPPTPVGMCWRRVHLVRPTWAGGVARHVGARDQGFMEGVKPGVQEPGRGSAYSLQCSSCAFDLLPNQPFPFFLFSHSLSPCLRWSGFPPSPLPGFRTVHIFHVRVCRFPHHPRPVLLLLLVQARVAERVSERLDPAKVKITSRCAVRCSTFCTHVCTPIVRSSPPLQRHRASHNPCPG